MIACDRRKDFAFKFSNEEARCHAKAPSLFSFRRQEDFRFDLQIITGRSQLVEIRGFEPRGRGFDSRPGYFLAPRLTFFTRSRSRQTSGCGSVGRLNSGAPSYDAANVAFRSVYLGVRKSEWRESQMARRPAATRNKWVRLPLASLYNLVRHLVTRLRLVTH